MPSPASIPASLPVPTVRGHTNIRKPSVATTLWNAAKKLPLSQEKRGDDKLDQASEIMAKFRYIMADNDLTIVQEKINR
jgi:hypothetical protein